MTINDFQGQVKISDVQNAFDSIVGRINTMINNYNLADGLSDIDYAKGSPKLGNSGYTLTVGGLKQLLGNYSNTLIGCKVYKVTDTSILVSDGIYIKDSNNAYRINSRFVLGDASWDMSSLYYDIDQGEVIFKSGNAAGTGESTVIEVDTPWTQPTITSNTSWGTFVATYNSSTAYNITNSNGYSYNGTTGQLIGTGISGVTWNLKEPVTLTGISINSSVTTTGSYSIEILVDDSIVYNGSSGNINISLNSVKARSVTVRVRLKSSSYILAYNLKNLILTGTIKQYAESIDGEPIVPSENIIKLCDLDWNSKDIILNANTGIQLEGVSGAKLTSSNKIINSKGGNSANSWQTLNTSDGGKFVAYTTTLHNSNGSMGGTTTFMGLTLNDVGYLNNSSQERKHFRSQALSLIYIPEGFTVTDSRSNQKCGRWVYNATLKR